MNAETTEPDVPSAPQNGTASAPGSSESAAGKGIRQPAVEAFGNSVRGLVADMRALSDAMPISMKALDVATQSAGSVFSEFMKKRTQKEEGKEEEVKISPDDFEELMDKSAHLHHSITALLIVPRSMLTALVSQFDAYIGHLLRALFLARTELVNTFEATLSLKELLDLGSIDEAREHVIEREIDKIIRLSHLDQIKWFERTLKVKFTELYDSVPAFVEIMERRNLFVHADGVVSRYYLRVCSRHDVDISERKQGEKLFVASGKQSYRDWPLFSEFRDSPEFLTAFEQIFGEKFAFSKESVESANSEGSSTASLAPAVSTTTPAAPRSSDP